MKRSLSRVITAVLGTVILCSCEASSKQESSSSYSIYGGGNGWTFNHDLWVHDRILTYNGKEYNYFALTDSVCPDIRMTIFNGDLSQEDILGAKVIDEATTEHNGLLGEEGGWSVYTPKSSKTDHILIAARGSQRRFYYREIHGDFPQSQYKDSPFETYWSEAGIRLGHTTLSVYDLLQSRKDPLNPFRLVATYSIEETTAIMSALNDLQSDYDFYNNRNRPKDRNDIGREMGRQYRMVFADGNDLLPAFYLSQCATFCSVCTYVYLKDTKAYDLLSEHLDMAYDPTYDPDAHIDD